MGNVRIGYAPKVHAILTEAVQPDRIEFWEGASTVKTKEEQNALKEKEVEAESKEPRKLTEEELAQVSSGLVPVTDD